MSLKIVKEEKVDSDPCVLTWDNKLFVGTEDGSIKSFDENLSPCASWKAHQTQIFAIAAGCDRVFSSSNDGGARVWSREGERIAELPSISGADIGTLHLFDTELYIGDESGSIVIYENDKEKARYNVMEEVKDLALSRPFLFSVRDLDVTVTEIKPDESKMRFTTRHTMEGRAPLRISGDKLLFMARGGNTLELHDASVENKFKKLHEIKVSNMIVTSLSVSGDIAWTAGWDGTVRRWKMAGDRLEPGGELSLGSCVNALASSAPDNVFAALAGGRVVRVQCV